MNRFMESAIKLAEENLEIPAGGPFGAVVVKNNKIVGKGKNEVLKGKDPTAHAEVMAIRDACKKIKSHDLSGCILYTNCYPCPMCMSAIIWANIKTVYYGNTSKDAKLIGFRDDFIYNHIKNIDNIIDINSIDHDKTIETFKKYNNLKYKKNY